MRARSRRRPPYCSARWLNYACSWIIDLAPGLQGPRSMVVCDCCGFGCTATCSARLDSVAGKGRSDRRAQQFVRPAVQPTPVHRLSFVAGFGPCGPWQLPDPFHAAHRGARSLSRTFSPRSPRPRVNPNWSRTLPLPDVSPLDSIAGEEPGRSASAAVEARRTLRSSFGPRRGLRAIRHSATEPIRFTQSSGGAALEQAFPAPNHSGPPSAG